MKEFMFLFRGDNDVWDSKSPEEQQEHMQHWEKWIGEMAEQGKFVSGERLLSKGNTVLDNGKIMDRPMTEGKELVGGYLRVKAESLSEATEMAKGCPGFEWEGGAVEVREVWPE
ncbi:hypothetical protein AWE51_17385 [Aquimarina aggregata]|uniref:YCII-related domain-containing protein n=1 Tax=Aquimarina aggregata TaxID=1642818 RepID=A0A162WYC6_9FLAO|nr:YciI family protein [Aquimarina aggregata]KZS38330.1 hypothetical protein AWE51_17385 [Aquimarina aggregata]